MALLNRGASLFIIRKRFLWGMMPHNGLASNKGRTPANRPVEKEIEGRLSPSSGWRSAFPQKNAQGIPSISCPPARPEGQARFSFRSLSKQYLKDQGVVGSNADT